MSSRCTLGLSQVEGRSDAHVFTAAGVADFLGGEDVMAKRARMSRCLSAYVHRNQHEAYVQGLNMVSALASIPRFRALVPLWPRCVLLLMLTSTLASVVLRLAAEHDFVPALLRAWRLLPRAAIARDRGCHS